MSVGGATWASAAPIVPGGVSDPTDPFNSPQGAARPYYAAWWKFTPATSGVLIADTLASTGTDPDTIVAVYSGTEASPTQVGYNDDGGDVGYLSQATFNVTAGVEYHVEVGTYASDGSGVTGYVLTLGEVGEYVSVGAGGDGMLGTRVNLDAVPAVSEPTAVAGLTTGTDAWNSYSQTTRDAYWYVPKQTVGRELVVEATRSTGDRDNIRLFVRAFPTGMDGGSWATMTRIADNLTTPGYGVQFTVDPNRIYVLGVGVAADDGSVTDYQITVSEPHYGGWRGDAQEQWVETAHTWGRPEHGDGDKAWQNFSFASDPGGGSPDAAMWAAVTDAAWNLTGSESYATGGEGVPTELEVTDLGTGASTGYSASWRVQTKTLVREGSGYPGYGQIPESVKNEPGFVGVEWVADAVPESQRVVVTLRGYNPQEINLADVGDQVYVKVVGVGNGEVFQPALRTRAAVAGQPTLGVVEVTTATNYGTLGAGSFIVDDLAVAPDGTVSIGLEVIDEHTQSGVIPPYPVPNASEPDRSNWWKQYPTDVALEALFQPGYRVIYSQPQPSTIAAPLRLFPRRDNRAIGSARTLRGNPARIHPRQL